MAITCTPATPVAKQNFCRIDVAGASEHDTVGYDPAKYPSEPERRSYLRFVKGGVEYGRSYVFSVSADGNHAFFDYMFPSAGNWTVTLCRADTNAVLLTLAVSVS
jgi:hypothetical protein